MKGEKKLGSLRPKTYDWNRSRGGINSHPLLFELQINPVLKNNSKAFS